MQKLSKEKVTADLQREIKTMKEKRELVRHLGLILDVFQDPEDNDTLSIVTRKLADYRIKQMEEAINFFEELIEELNPTCKEVA